MGGGGAADLELSLLGKRQDQQKNMHTYVPGNNGLQLHFS